MTPTRLGRSWGRRAPRPPPATYPHSRNDAHQTCIHEGVAIRAASNVSFSNPTGFHNAGESEHRGIPRLWPRDASPAIDQLSSYGSAAQAASAARPVWSAARPELIESFCGRWLIPIRVRP